jgi:hypothetical protein
LSQEEGRYALADLQSRYDRISVQMLRKPKDIRRGRFTQTLCFAHDGRSKLLEVAEHKLNWRLVDLIRGMLLFAPVITSDPIPQCATVNGAVSPADAEALQRVIREPLGRTGRPLGRQPSALRRSEPLVISYIGPAVREA